MADILSDEQLNEIQDAFRLFDKKGENQISGNDLITVFQALKCNVSQAEMTEYMEVLDPSGTGMVQYQDFLQLVAKRLQTQETADDLIKAFRVFDKEHKGTLSPDEMRHILTHFGECMEAAEVEDYLVEADLKAPHLKPDGSKTGMINYVAFIAVMLDLSDEEQNTMMGVM
uniref:EF-hand domain-containing protein n=1 Tax=Hemiselmis tepida TaxID=464990 RepID=A0A7S0VN04_9CRYP|mmetsp:Transcript_20357/g.51381  ORF Transcript_20357/g.51381 Transcript_20357/m.51381 type:complete len:171 (+) Transcript_20357:39-551(+)|eukprot:CAMPEP_0174916886 /NCGR_PEP_ID=MMETSP1355-20121228/2113_1 /TAXON_ID=464990 /ORGANISM="Hemiselmis tepida, Strain CCMP443" /LENGTH=170 /DNA_ID=CAMNT_0016161929 /DNA_START=31 /DNA_END=543 /DNA_ORIENTATION=-